jgi:predicted dehydrogenase
MGQRLRVGIIGLGRYWRKRYAPALQALSDLYAVAAVCDPIPQQAATEAARLRCPAAAGPSELVERDDVAAVLLLDLGWQRLWPLERAVRAGKPVFCLPLLEDDEANADTVAARVREAAVPVMMAARAGFTPAARHLLECQRERLGAVRLLVCETISNRPGALDSGTLVWLLSLLGAEPTAITGAGRGAAGLLSLTLEAANGRALQLTHWHAPGAPPRLRLQVVAEGGQATLEGGRRLSWTEAGAAHSLTLAGQGPVERLLLTGFHRVVTEGQAPWPSLADSHRALVCLRAAARSRAEGRVVSL